MSAPDALHLRIERLLRRPEEVRARVPWWSRLRARFFGVDETFRTVALEDAAARALTRDTWPGHASALIAELEENVALAEHRVAAGEPVASEDLMWLASLHRWIVRVEEALDRPHALDRLVRGLGRRPLDVRPGPRPPRTRAIDALLDEAAHETARLGRRQRLLEAARRALLDGGGADGTAKRIVAHELAQVRRMIASGARADIDLAHQIESAIARRAPVATTLAAAASYLGGHHDAHAHVHDRLARPLHDAPASDVPDAIPPALAARIERAYDDARARLERDLELASPARALALRRRRSFVAPGAHLAAMRAMLAADARLEIGGALSQARFLAEDPRDEEVAFPAERMRLAHARSVEDLRDAVIDDPRRVVHQLASGELLVRRHLRPRRTDRARSGANAEVRLFLLDGSTSMHGARARMRDAVILAELAALMERLEGGGRVQQLLYYRFFHTESEPTRRVRTLDEARRAIDDVVGVERSGGTDIERAIVDALREIEWARRHDVALTRAQIVLVSDGEATLDASAIVSLRERLGVPTRIAIVALGGEGPSLRALADAQRRDGGARVFYHHVSDVELEAWERGDGAPSPSYAAQEPPWDEISALLPSSGVPDEDPRPLEDALAELGISDDASAARLDATRRDLRALEARFDRWLPALPSGPDTLAGADDDDDLSRTLDAIAVLETLDTPGVPRIERMADAIAVLVRVLHALAITPARYAELIARHPARFAAPIAALRRRHGR
ncbi:vWA domain-containing protein [Sandaracinus amylolyticus]|uniref:VWFA domain-containing protein n=1 Tax=Sandaracinus amylolyticus TaxID=927083 RepID=A0A0F6W8L4_9BACT|nr:vWA domain-containing protein [Sandaracinus amylolyticus]AKF10096.1 hypothetical protein DB32_007245 [Sandaracinus amylolyticus]